MNPKAQNFAYLLKILRKLSRDEIKTLRQYFDFYYDLADNKPRKLLELILCKIDSVSDDKLLHIIHQSFKKSETSNLTSRIIQNIHESLVTEPNIRKKGTFKSYEKAYLTVSKRIMQIRVLWGKGISTKIPLMLGRIEKEAIKYELFDELIQILLLKQEYWGHRKGLAYYLSLDAEIEKHKTTAEAIQKAKKACRMITLTNDEKGDKFSLLQFVEQALIESKAAFTHSPSRYLFFYLGILRIEYFQQLREYEAAAEACMELATFIEENLGIFSIRRLAIAYIQVANNALFIERFDLARKYVQIAKELLPLGDFNLVVAEEIEFLACFYAHDSSSAEQVIQHLLERKPITQAPKRWHRKVFYFANLLFVKNDFKESNRLLQECGTIRNDKDGWNIGIRFLEVLNYIELQQLEIADLNHTNLKRHLYAQRRKGKVAPRWFLISNILGNLIKAGFDFSKAYEASSAQLSLLESSDQEYKWEVCTPEMIQFQSWFLRKLGQPQKSYSV